jgi:hypothetical protein
MFIHAGGLIKKKQELTTKNEDESNKTAHNIGILGTVLVIDHVCWLNRLLLVKYGSELSKRNNQTSEIPF